jgi:hypothetical protein
MVCTSVSEEGGDEESVVSEALSLLSYTLRYVSLTDLVSVCQFGLRESMKVPEPVYMCEWGGGGEESVGPEVLSLLSYTFRYVSLTDLDIVYQFGSWELIHLCTCVNEEGVDGEGTESDGPTLCVMKD